MPTTIDYINQLKLDKENLVNNLNEKGIEADNSETFTSLVPKVLDIQGGSATNIVIKDGSYLFYDGARIEYMNELLGLCKELKSTNNMYWQCDDLTELILYLDTSNVKDMGYMFGVCSKLTKIILYFNTSSVKTFEYMLSNCSSLTEVDVSSFNTSNLQIARYMFYNDKKIVTLDLSNFDFGKVVMIGSILNGCTALTNFKSFKNLGKGYTQKRANYSEYKLDLSYCPNLTHDSLMNVINNLYDLNLTYNVANGGTLYTQSLVLGTTNISKLSAEELSACTSKGWSVS